MWRILGMMGWPFVKANILEGSHTLGGSQSARMQLDRKEQLRMG